MIIVPGQRPGANRHALVRWVGGAIQMIDSEPQCLLRGGIAADLHVAAPPAGCPGRLVFRQHAAPTEVSCSIKLVPRPFARFQTVGVAPRHGDSALEAHNLSGACFPAPGPFQSVDGGRRKIVAIDLQRRCGGHGDAFAGTLGAPHAEILIEPFRDEPEIDTLKRRFECDLDFPVLELQLDQLQPNRALAYGYKAQRAQADANAGSLQKAGLG